MIEAALESYGAAGVVAPESHGDAGVVALYNEGYASGMFGSVQTGIRYVAGRRDCRAALLFPVDVPLVAAETIVGLVGAWKRGAPHGASSADAETVAGLAGAWERGESPQFAVPVHDGKNGHPLLIPRGRFEEILMYTGENGLKGVRAAYDADMIKYATNDAGCVLDMDTLEDYAKLVEFYGKSKDG